MVVGLPPLGLGSIGALAVLNFVLLLFVLYDVLVLDEMLLLEKAIWILLAVGTGLVGIVLYLYLIKYEKEFIADHTDLVPLQESFSSSGISQLERLSRLKEKGDLTEEEFEQMKEEALDG